MSTDAQSPAPRWRQALAALVDVAVGAALVRALSTRAQGAGPAPPSKNAARLLSADAVREQVGSPGQLLMGLRTVDRRTGARVALWRTMVLLGADLGGRALARRLAPPEQTSEQRRERERLHAEMRAVYERHPTDADARRAERRSIYERHPGPITVDLPRALAPTLVVSLVNRRLRRRLAPTSVVLARRP